MLTGIDGAAPELSLYYDRMHNWYNTELVFRDTRTMIRFSALLRVFTLNTYFPQVVVICFLSTIGLSGMFRFMRSLAPGRDLALIVLLFMTPSVLLWTSGLIKEAFLFYAMGLLLFQIECWQQRSGKPVMRILAVLLAVFVLLTIKAYVFFLFAPVVRVSTCKTPCCSSSGFYRMDGVAGRNRTNGYGGLAPRLVIGQA
jgi:hypothetical protein